MKNLEDSKSVLIQKPCLNIGEFLATVFSRSSHLFSLRFSKIYKIYNHDSVINVPSEDNIIVGKINCNNQEVYVADLAKFFNIEGHRDVDDQVVILLHTDKGLFGLLVDSICGFIDIRTLKKLKPCDQGSLDTACVNDFYKFNDTIISDLDGSGLSSLLNNASLNLVCLEKVVLEASHFRPPPEKEYLIDFDQYDQNYHIIFMVGEFILSTPLLDLVEFSEPINQEELKASVYDTMLVNYRGKIAEVLNLSNILDSNVVSSKKSALLMIDSPMGLGAFYVEKVLDIKRLSMNELKKGDHNLPSTISDHVMGTMLLDRGLVTVISLKSMYLSYVSKAVSM